MKKLSTVILASVSALFLQASFAAELKVGIIDMNQILQKSPLMISLNNDLIKRFQPRQTELADAQKKLQDESSKLNMNGATMTPADRTKLQNQIINDKANVQILDASLQRDLGIAKDEALQKFMTKLNDVIARIAKQDHYDLIQQNSGFAYVNTRLDITQEVLQQVS